jgi:hypothetical protein
MQGIVVRSEGAMKQYFLDVVSGNDSEFEYNGHEFAALEKAIEFAGLIAIDLETMQEGAGSTVVVRDPHGRSYFSASVQIPELAFAGDKRRTSSKSRSGSITRLE